MSAEERDLSKPLLLFACTSSHTHVSDVDWMENFSTADVSFVEERMHTNIELESDQGGNSTLSGTKL